MDRIVKLLTIPVAFGFLLNAAGCASDHDSASNAIEPPSALILTVLDGVAVTPDEDSGVSTSFTLTRPASALQIVIACDRCTTRITGVTGPDGDILFAGDAVGNDSVTEAHIPQPSSATLNLPLTPDALTYPGGTYRVTGLATGSAEISSPTISVIAKQESDSSKGVLNIHLVYAGSIANSKNALDAVDDATDIVSRILNDAGVHANFLRHYVPELTGSLPDVRQGDPLYEEMGKLVRRGVPVYLASRAPGVDSGNYEYSLEGSSPGPLVPTQRGAVVVSMTDAAGPDGLFNGSGFNDSTGNYNDDDRGNEIRLLAESIAHGVLRYVGLQPIATFSGDDVIRTDGLNSPSCTSRPACEGEKEVRRNIMFPYPVQIYTRDYVDFFERWELVKDQRQLLLRSPFVG